MRRVIVLALIAIGILAVRTSVATQTPHAPPPSADYILALRAANSFLAAWAMRDADAGVAQMSDALRRANGGDLRQREAELRQFVTGLGNPSHQAFSIGAGLWRHDDRYAFPVSLFELYSNAAHGYAWTDTLELVRDGDEWRVDRLPRSGDAALR